MILKAGILILPYSGVLNNICNLLHTAFFTNTKYEYDLIIFCNVTYDKFPLMHTSEYCYFCTKISIFNANHNASIVFLWLSSVS